MKIKAVCFLTVLLLASQLWSQKKIEWVPPLDIPLSLSGTFGEPRSTHFHLGIDIKTQGKEGWEVRSVAPGYISRIRVSLGGYGKTVYINHPDETTSVYAHLKKFAPKIEAYIKSMQYEKESYTLQQFLKREVFTIEAGEVIGYSGNTGSSSGPHLHFEIRDAKSQKPLNPLLFDLPISDSQRPQIQKLFLFYPKNNAVLTHSEPIALHKVNDSTYNTPVVSSSGKMGLGLQMFDRQDLSYNKNGIYKAKLEINGKTITQFQFDQLNYSDSDKLFINIDYPTFKKNKNKIQKLFFQDHKPLTFMKLMTTEGLFNIEPGKSYQVKVVVEDFSGNTSYIVMYIEGIKKQIPNKKLDGKLIEPRLDYLFSLNDKEVYFPKKTFFQDAFIQIEEAQNNLSIGPNLFPFQKPYEIRFKINEENTLKLRQTFIAKKIGKKISFLPTVIDNGHWTTKLKDMGDYTLAKDSIPPQIVPSNFKANQWLSKFRFMKVKISDDFSGIKSYRGTINGKWILFEYDPKRNLLTYDFSDKTFKLAKHELEIEVEDNVGNKSVYKATFFKKYNLN
ncbi:M23 family metallopeptidase [Flavobacteriaceae bacterium]|nr:M23 family metallopeptidase [Flavobacteriaceae bacterium]